MGVIRYIFFMFALCFFLLAMLVSITAQHEYLHQLIFKKYGINSTVKYYFWESFKEEIMSNPFNIDVMGSQPIGVTYPDQNSSGKCDESCTMLHTQVEIADSAATTIMMSLFMLFALYIIYQEFKSLDNYKEEKPSVESNRLFTEEYKKLTGREANQGAPQLSLSKLSSPSSE